MTPAEACNIAGALQLDVPAFDVNSACTSFFVHLHLLSLMRPEALPPFVLVVVPEAVTRAVDYSDRATAVLLGDGAVAAVVSRRASRVARVIVDHARVEPGGARQGRRPARRPLPAGGPRRADVRGQEDGRAARPGLRDAHAVPGRALHFVGHQANLPHARGRAAGSATSRRRPPPHQRRVVRQHRRRRRAVRAVDALGRVDGRTTTSPWSASARGSPGRAISLRFGARMTYAEFQRAAHFAPHELLAFAHGTAGRRPAAGVRRAAAAAADADARPHRLARRDGGARGPPSPSARCARRLVLPVPFRR